MAAGEVEVRVAVLDEGELADIVRDTVAAVLAHQEHARAHSGWGPRIRAALRDFKDWFTPVTVIGVGHTHDWRDVTTIDGLFAEEVCRLRGCPSPRRSILKTRWYPGMRDPRGHVVPAPPPMDWEYGRR